MGSREHKWEQFGLQHLKNTAQNCYNSTPHTTQKGRADRISTHKWVVNIKVVQSVITDLSFFDFSQFLVIICFNKSNTQLQNKDFYQ